MLLLGGHDPWLSTPLRAFAGSCGVFGIALGIEDIVVNTKIGNKVIFFPWVLVLLQLSGSGGLSLAFDGVASGD